MNKPDCDHQWTDYGTLKSGGNPQIEIEACVRCGVQRKKPSKSPKEWTPENICEQIGLSGVSLGTYPPLKTFIDYVCAAHKAAIDAERERGNGWFMQLEAALKRITQREQQLAAEKEAHKKTAEQFVDMKAYADYLELKYERPQQK